MSTDRCEFGGNHTKEACECDPHQQELVKAVKKAYRIGKAWSCGELGPLWPVWEETTHPTSWRAERNRYLLGYFTSEALALDYKQYRETGADYVQTMYDAAEAYEQRLEKEKETRTYDKTLGSSVFT